MTVHLFNSRDLSKDHDLFSELLFFMIKYHENEADFFHYHSNKHLNDNEKEL